MGLFEWIFLIAWIGVGVLSWFGPEEKKWRDEQ